MQKKRVGCLYRVSTTMQATRKNIEEADIPTQRTACMKFIGQHPEWEYTKEYVEIGVSGFKNTIEERDKLLEAKDDIANGMIDVLLVFMFDRLGRIEEETPIVVKSFVDMGAEVWSVREGQRKFEAHIDGLLNYLTFWQAAGESKKTSERVSNAMTIMAEQGQYTGGRTPFGYRAVETGQLTKKRLPEKTLVIDEDEAFVVRKAYDLAIKSGFGCHRIAKILNTEGFTTRGGAQWSCSAVSNMLNNPIYKGCKAYNRTSTKGKGKRQYRVPESKWTTSEMNPDWVIISEGIWDAVRSQRALAAQRQKKQKEYNISLPDTVSTRGRLYFVGIAFCSECGAKMITGYSPYRWKTEDGVWHRRDNPVYRCYSRASGKIGCKGMTSYAKDKVDPAIVEEIKNYLSDLEKVELSEDIIRIRKENVSVDERKIKNLKKQLIEANTDKHNLEGEVLKALRGEGRFSADLLTRLFDENKEKIEQLEAGIVAAENVLKKKHLEYDDLVQMKKIIPIWSETFDNASFDEQRKMLAKIIERVEIGREGVQIQLRIHIEEFLHSSVNNVDFMQKQKGDDLTRFHLIGDPIDTDKEGNSLTLQDIMSDDDNIFDCIDLRLKSEQMYKLIEKYLSEREQNIIIMRYGLYCTKPLTQREVAGALNISRSYVSRIEKKAINTLKKHFKREGFF